MSREIKFRVWGLGLKPPRYRMPDNLELYGATSLGEALDQFTTSPNWVVEQFTGFKDSKEIEIYEGDIVTTKPGPGCLTSLVSPEEFTTYTHGVVRFSAGSWCVQQPHLGSTLLGDFTDCECCPVWSVEVIGNIHQHSHLLKS